jgi:hypothetical protein
MLSIPEPLAGLGYRKPATAADVWLDIVTPTRNRPTELITQAKRLGPQLFGCDRWIVVEDASDESPMPVMELTRYLPSLGSLFAISLTYQRSQYIGGVNRARHVAVSVARPDAWIVEVDDHDYVSSEALATVREAIVYGAAFIYADCRHRDADGGVIGVYAKPDYEPFLLSVGSCPCEGLRAYPKRLYDAVGGYRFHGRHGVVGENEYPAGDYGLFMRMEQYLGGVGFVHVPSVLADTHKIASGITGQFGLEQEAMAGKLRAAAQEGVL